MLFRSYPVIHGNMGEDGTVQGLFRLLNKPWIGSGVTSSGPIKCSSQIVDMFSDFARDVSIDPCMLCCCSCHV